jgi:cytoskeletal protein RodZ
MDKKKFDKIMDQWAAHEMEAAPDLSPNQEVYRKLEEKKKKPRFSLFSWPVRVVAVGIAAALIALVIIVEPPKEVEPLLGLKETTVADVEEKEEAADRIQFLEEEERAIEAQAGKETGKETKEKVGEVSKSDPAKLRKKVQEDMKTEAFEKKPSVAETPPVKSRMNEIAEKTKEADKEVLVQPLEVVARQRKEEEPETKDVKRALKRSPVAAVAAAAPAQVESQKIQFQLQAEGTKAIKGWDIDSLQDEILSLSSEDNYRLQLIVAEESYVYVLQTSAEDRTEQLFPNPVYSPMKNPLQAGKISHIPLSPNWFFVEKEEGEMRLYVIASDKPIHDWDDVETKIKSGWLGRLEENRTKQKDRISIQVLKFNIRQ